MNNGTMRKLNIRPFEKIIICLIVAVIAVSVFLNMTFKQRIYQLTIEIQNLENEIEEQQNLNSAYQTEIRESTSFENLSRLANEYGLKSGNDTTFVLKEN